MIDQLAWVERRLQVTDQLSAENWRQQQAAQDDYERASQQPGGPTTADLLRYLSETLRIHDAYEAAISSPTLMPPPPLPPSDLPGAPQTPGGARARTAAAEASAAAAVAWASAAAGHEAAAEAAAERGAAQPATQSAEAAAEWERSAAAWRAAYCALEEAARAAPEAEAVRQASAAVEAAWSFRGQRRSLHG